MILRFGRKELLPSWSQGQFNALMIAGFAGTVVLWSFVKYLIGDDLYISYFHLANIAGPPFAASLMIRRRSVESVSPLAARTAVTDSWLGVSVIAAVFGAGHHIHRDKVGFHRVQHIGELMLPLQGDAAHDLRVHIHANFLHLIEDAVSLVGQVYLVDPSILRIGAAFHEPALFKAVDEATECHLAQIQHLRQLRLRNAFFPMTGNTRQDPPLGTSDA
jgi:hypothetical protein